MAVAMPSTRGDLPLTVPETGFSPVLVTDVSSVVRMGLAQVCTHKREE